MAGSNLNLRRMQWEHQNWANRNFGGQHSLHNAVLGMGEEFGELCHAILKFNQGIRNVDEGNVRELIIDAHCDLTIFGFGVAEHMGYDFGDELEATWDKVKSRDWQANPETGGS